MKLKEGEIVYIEFKSKRTGDWILITSAHYQDGWSEVRIVKKKAI